MINLLMPYLKVGNHLRIDRIDSLVLYKGVVSSFSLKTVQFVNIITMLFFVHMKTAPAGLTYCSQYKCNLYK